MAEDGNAGQGSSDTAPAGLGGNTPGTNPGAPAANAAGNIADDLHAHRQPAPDRNAVVAAMLSRLIPALEEFPRSGLTPHLAQWKERDALRDHEVRIENLGEVTRGMARGIDAHGALLVETPGGVQRFISGEVSVRRS